jgi:hypothetical protein
MPSSSKIKGSGFERDIAKFLTERFGFSFIRNPSGSGAFVGGRNAFRKNTLTEAQVRHTKGDIIPPDEFPLFNAEAKFYAEFPFHQLFEGSSQLEEWINQLMTAGDPDDMNILFMKFNRRGCFVAVQATMPWNTDCNHVVYNSPKYGKWMIYSLASNGLS